MKTILYFLLVLFICFSCADKDDTFGNSVTLSAPVSGEIKEVVKIVSQISFDKDVQAEILSHATTQTDGEVKASFKKLLFGDAGSGRKARHLPTGFASSPVPKEQIPELQDPNQHWKTISLTIAISFLHLIMLKILRIQMNLSLFPGGMVLIPAELPQASFGMKTLPMITCSVIWSRSTMIMLHSILPG